MKSIYIETTIPSYITAKDSRDVLKLTRQVTSRNFWEKEGQNYKLYISDFVLAECEKGNKEAAQRRLNLIAGLDRLPTTKEVLALAPIYKKLLNIPDKSTVDAFHLAVATINQIDHVLSFNFSHMGIKSYGTLLKYNDSKGLNTPLLITPDYFFGMEEDEDETL
jgi:hypothetical protein